MKLLHIFNRIDSIICYIKGYLFNILFFGFKAKKLKLHKNIDIKGKFIIGKRVSIGSNVRMYHNVMISDNVKIGDNVELRCNKSALISIGDKSAVNRNSILYGNVKIGNNVAIAPNCHIIGGNHNFSTTKIPLDSQGSTRKGIIIENDVWLGAGVIVLDGVSIGQFSIIGAGSVVTKNIPPFSIAVGNPCKVIKSRK